MKEQNNSLIDEAVELELNVARLYLLFYRYFPNDADFWWQLYSEERNHGALIQSGRNFLPGDRFPLDLMSARLEPLVETNRKIGGLIRKYTAAPPSREEAFRTALSLEYSAGELHFQTFMDSEPKSGMATVFKELNGNDKDHALRIMRYMRRNGISGPPETSPQADTGLPTT